MAYPSSFDTFAGTTATGTSLLTSPDHALDHRTLGSAAAGLETTVGTTLGTNVLKDFAAGDFPTRINSSGVLQQVVQGTLNASTLGSPTITGGTINNAIVGSPTVTGGTINAAVVGSPTITGGTINNPVIGTPAISGGTMNNGVFGTPATTGGTLNSAVIGTPAITGGTMNAGVFGTPAITGGTATSTVLNGATIGTPAITGGTMNAGVFGTPSVTGGTLSAVTLGTPIMDHFTSSSTAVPTISDHALSPTVGSVADAAGGTLTVNAAVAQVYQSVFGTTAGNRTIGTPTNPTDGQVLAYRLKTSASANATAVWAAVFRFPGGTAGTPALGTTASAWNYYAFRYNAIDSKWDGQGTVVNIA